MHFPSLFTRAECIFQIAKESVLDELIPDSIENGIFILERVYDHIAEREERILQHAEIHRRIKLFSLKFIRATRNRLSTGGMYYSLRR